MPSDPLVEHWAVVLVHGVGDTEPGRMIDSVAPVMVSACKGLEFKNGHQVHFIPDSEDQHFPVFMREGSVARHGVTMAEVHWADLSRIRQGNIQYALGVFQLIFGLWYVADRMGRHASMASHLLRVCICGVYCLICGPLLAMYLFVFLASLLSLVILSPGMEADRGIAALFLLLVGLIFAISGLVGIKAANSIDLAATPKRPASSESRYLTKAISVYLRSHYWAWIVAIGAAALLAAACRIMGWGDLEQRSIARWLNERYFSEPRSLTEWGIYLAALWQLEDLINIGITVFLGSGLIVVVLTWCRTAVSAWSLNSKEGADKARVMTAAYACGVLLYSSWMLSVWVMDIIAQRVIDKNDHSPGRSPWGGYAVYWYEDVLFVFVLAAILAVGVTYWRRQRWLSKRSGTGRAATMPRLIVNAAILAVVLLYALAVAVITPLQAASIAADSTWLMPKRRPWFLIGGLILLAILLAALLSTYLRNAIHIGMDIVNHFHSPQQGFPRRKRIALRFREVVKLLANCGCTNYLFIAHSQGTVIVLDCLCTDTGCKAILSGKQLTLLTFGSPFTHLYQHYFPQDYGPRYLEGLQGYYGFLRWCNVYRIDDYVGTCIESLTPNLPTNIELGEGQHTAYWKEDAFKQVAELLPGFQHE